LTDILEVIAGKNDLVLLSRACDLDARQHFHATNYLLAQEVVYFDPFSIVRNVAVDGEVCIYEFHLVFVSLSLESIITGKGLQKRYLGHTSDEVLNVRAHCPDAGDALTRSKPYGHFELATLLAEELHFHVHVFEIAR
jgi:hypothetical protein